METVNGKGMLVLFFLGMLRSACSQQHQQGGPNLGHDLESLLLAMQEARSARGEEPHDFYSLIPTTPPPEEINCYVEIVPPIRVGGVCTRMGRPRPRRRGHRHGRRRMPVAWACQAGVHLEIGSPHCGSSQSRRQRLQPND